MGTAANRAAWRLRERKLRKARTRIGRRYPDMATPGIYRYSGITPEGTTVTGSMLLGRSEVAEIVAMRYGRGWQELTFWQAGDRMPLAGIRCRPGTGRTAWTRQE
jgi:hypothetical protein